MSGVWECGHEGCVWLSGWANEAAYCPRCGAFAFKKGDAGVWVASLWSYLDSSPQTAELLWVHPAAHGAPPAGLLVRMKGEKYPRRRLPEEKEGG